MSDEWPDSLASAVEQFVSNLERQARENPSSAYAEIRRAHARILREILEMWS